MQLTIDEVLALAPDAASAKAARGLTAPGQWPLLGQDAAAVWGECQGSGAKPYQTQVDLAGPAFRCSCPSRKFPCKHGLALLLIRAQEVSAFTGKDAPAWVTEWLASRADKAQKKEERQAERAAAPADPEAGAERERQRWDRLAGAAQELQRWLGDQVARGLGALDRSARPAWHAMAARMVDAQAPGLGQRVRDAADGLLEGDDWPERTLHRLGLLHLACEALQRHPMLAPATRADLRTVAGWPFEKADVLAQGEPVEDRWTVLGVATDLRDVKLTERRVWLHGERHGRRAWLLEHAFGGRGFETAWTTGTAVDATLVYFPGGRPLRAVVQVTSGSPVRARWPQADGPAEWQGVADQVAANPWTSLFPMVVPQAVVQHDDRLLAVAGDRVLPLHVGEADTWQLLAATGGRPVSLMGEWDGRQLLALTAWHGNDAPPLWSRRSE